MPILFQPAITSKRGADALPGRLIAIQSREAMRIGFLARIQDREGVYLIALTPGDRQFAPTVTGGQSFLDLGDEIVIEPAVTVASNTDLGQ